jgi:hypothetical protein
LRPLRPYYTVKQVSRYLYHAPFCIMILVSLHTKSRSMLHAEFVYKLSPPKWRILTMKTLSYKLRWLSICSFDQITSLRFSSFQSCFIYHVLTMCKSDIENNGFLSVLLPNRTFSMEISKQKGYQISIIWAVDVYNVHVKRKCSRVLILLPHSQLQLEKYWLLGRNEKSLVFNIVLVTYFFYRQTDFRFSF